MDGGSTPAAPSASAAAAPASPGLAVGGLCRLVGLGFGRFGTRPWVQPARKAPVAVASPREK
eukprot:6591781-Lingulodinium_polyedra.AAC.1